ncbi:exopolysaccharide biosynthesis polyprenyl glycosylphosphotransferase [Cellulosimicrobium sp. BIT-GX5]|uniref:Exopolysaccharide biosynthesis polyprenyl glycosylphosphotransferase n=1 Tax=Cellulosimicrobium composti TaxID=2672572 RepID=A0A6N7ZDE3_9MICO|nr:sugar transferase [Cellulosimicrobium composti]MTG87453.1 exopolysaccharide biosynthesis polyprenyl glycosylphosphotransferase [Cellulosimicrobium composti]
MSHSVTEDARRGLRTLLTSSPAARVRAARAAFAAQGWEVAYRRRLVLTDTAVIVVAVLVAYFLRWDQFINEPVREARVPYVVLSLLVGVAWSVSLVASRSRDPRVMGSGPTEYHRVFDGSWRLFAILAVLAFLFRFPEARGYLAFAFPLGLGGLLVGRYAWRQWLHGQRARGRMRSAVLAIGHRDQAERLIRDLNGRDESGYRVVGVCVPSGGFGADEEIHGVPVLGELRHAGEVATRVGADVVAVSGSDAITAEVVRRLGWELEPYGVDLMLTAELADVAGPRITITPAESVSLLHVDAPRFTGPKFAVKSVVDWAGAFLVTLAALPVLVIVALAVRCTSRGPVLFRQERVGRNGRTFSMYKFRSMRVGADREVQQLAERNEGAGPLFKMRDDPRVTPVGRVLRRYSLDELPQLFNVLRGDMSLVGPRPPLPSEVQKYEKKVRRRLLVKPGLTGLWQVGGRSDLSWEESVRLDVYYVENWTMFGDFLILARTARAVFGGSGAY